METMDIDMYIYVYSQFKFMMLEAFATSSKTFLFNIGKIISKH